MKATFKEVINQLQKGEFHPLYFLYGPEPLYIDKICNYAENNIIDEASRDFNQSIFYGKDTPIEEAIASAKEFPFGVERRVVIVKEAQNWASLDLLKKYAEQPSESTLLIVCYKTEKMNESIIKFFDKHAVLFSSPKVQNYKLPEWVANCATEHDFRISVNAANVLAEHIGNDLSRIDNEFSKLKLLLPAGSEVTTDIIERYIGISKQYNVFELRDALANHDEAKAYRIVNAFSQNVKANPIIVTINSLAQYYEAMLSYHMLPTKSPDKLREIFGARYSDKQLARESAIASQHSRVSLIKIISTLREFDARAKGVNNAAEADELYKELILRILH